jgi:hypothetical protein
MATKTKAAEQPVLTDHQVVLQALETAIDARVPVVLTGPPGCGKTAAVREVAARRQRWLGTIIASLREPSEFAGLPIVLESMRETYLAPPGWAKEANKHEAPIVFFDEVSTAPQSVQAALLRVVDELMVGELPLPVDTSMVAAMNPPDSAAGGWDLAAAFANRWLHLEWRGWGAKQWASWAKAQGWGHAGNMVGAFVLAKSSLLHAMPDDAVLRGKPWPSHRTWARACTVLAMAHSRGLDLGGPVSITLAAGCVGDHAAGELGTYLRELDLPDPRELLAHPDKWQVPPRGDRVWATLSSLCDYVIETKSARDWERAFEVLAIANAEGQGDIAIAAGQDMARQRPKGAKVPKALREFLPLLEAAGMHKAAA